jgi:glycosyltransferase involved in cell wall biosynthesis
MTKTGSVDPSAASSPLHIVQIGFDDTVFETDAPSDTLRRQMDYALELARRRPGSIMTVIMLTTLGSARPIEQDNLRIIPLKASRLARWPRLYWLLRQLHAVRPIAVIATQTVNSEAWLALWFGVRHGTPVIGQIHYDLFSPAARRESVGAGIIGALRHAVSMQLLRHMAAVRVVGSGIATRLRAAGVQRVAVIPVPVTMAPKLGDGLEEPGRSTEPRVLFVGRLVPQKNLELWLRVAQRVAQQVPAAQFEIVGDGPQRLTLEAYARRLGLEHPVQFSGAIPHAELAAAYNRASVFLLTSLYEGFGRVVAEAAVHSLPVVAPKITGVEDIVVHGVTGFLHAPGDAAALSDSVIRLLQDNHLRTELGRRGKEVVLERFDPRRLTQEWVSLLIAPVDLIPAAHGLRSPS